MNKVLKEKFSGRPLDEIDVKPRNAVEEAQDLCYRAFDAFGRTREILARKALTISPDCADAYVILAESARTTEKARELHAQALQAGRRALGEQTFEDDVGRFWGLPDTRPYMRALMGQASVRERLGDREGAAADYAEMLRLNPNDNQGARDFLLPLLIALGRDAEARDLLGRYRDASASWAYGRVLLAYRTAKRAPLAADALKKALKLNPHVPGCLLSEDPDEIPPTAYSPGSFEEALICVGICRKAWEATPGALEWLAAAVDTRKPRKKSRKR